MKCATVASTDIKTHPRGHCLQAGSYMPPGIETLREAMRQGASRAFLGWSQENSRYATHPRQEIQRAYEAGYRIGTTARQKALHRLEQEISKLSEQELMCPKPENSDTKKPLRER